MIYGVAVNDLPNHRTQICKYVEGLTKTGKKKKVTVWQCPFYSRWFLMLSRCYKVSELEKHPTYNKVTVCEEWLKFSNFKTWMETQPWQGNQLDKDILFPGNTEYSKDTCCFVSQEVNKFILEKTASRDLPIGVIYHKKKAKFIAAISTGKNAKIEHLGNFNCPNKAHLAWAERKLEFAKEIASKQSDKRVAKALVDRYTQILVKAKEKV